VQTSIYKNKRLKVMLVTDGHTVDDCLEAFENVLRGQGFHLKGHIEIVEECNYEKEGEQT